ncbi:MurR/RpiR family transcriptional regulator [Lawsonibacter sp. OA9]|uniref:MurR/RpiR family transcriptional regulator n=1 Tax=Eubacteriales TaxID=186802 RepID=UPI001F0537E6|nr:MurR/RpiR family transcriptional regulator [Lawsonibacter sp. OA9]MCH1979987.1 MurR/RpiR family transcriptional regulator [Lawsonibacter sp. OA9]
MTLQELLNQIRDTQTSLSDAQRLVAAYILENYNQIPFLSISSLAKKIGVSDNTIVKFCNRVGFSKFKEFKNVFADYAHSELVMFNKISEDTSDTDNKDFFACEMEDDVSAIQAALLSPVNQENLPKLLSQMDQAKHIYITGGRASGIVASLFANLLRYLGLKVYDVPFGVGDYLDRLTIVEPEDLVIALAFPRYTAQVVSALADLHSKGIPIALITDSVLSPAQPYADLAFHCPVSSGYYFPCYSGCLSLINVICRAAAANRKSEAAEHLRKLEAHLLERGVFL